jgi:hypothetical protein
LLGIVFSGCQIEKRVHRPGYHVQYKNSKSAKTAKIEHNKPDKQSKDAEVHAFIESDEYKKSMKDPLLVTKKNKDNHPDIRESKVEAVKLFKPDVNEDISLDCETIVYTNGVEALVKIEEITPTVIRYTRCDLQNGPLITVNRKDVNKIVYANGAEDIITNSAGEGSGKGTVNTAATFDGIGVVSFISGLVGILFAAIIFGPVAIIFGIISLARTSSPNREFKGKAFGVIGLLLGVIVTIIMILYLSTL